MATFRLDQQPWIHVLGANGLARSVSLMDVFSNARDLLGIGGSPLEAAAILRFLLAIVHLTDTPTSLSEWATLWNNRADFMRRCARYVEVQSDAWDLFHETIPFGQLPGLNKTLNPAHILIYDAARKNNAVFVDHSIEDNPVSIPAAALARGVIVTNAYAGSSGGGYRSGPLAMRSIGMLSGRTLDETLLLNLLVQKQPPAFYDWRTYGHSVPGALDLARRYLWASRRVRLIRNGHDVSASTIMLAPGDEMPEAERGEDPMVVMRKDAKGTAYVPLRLESDRALWRSAHVLLSWHEKTRPLAVVSQLSRLITRGHVLADQPVCMRVCAVAGDAQGPSTELWRDETLPFGLSVVADENRYSMLVKAVSTAEETVTNTRKSIYSFSARYLQNGAPSAPDKKDVGKLADELSLGLTGFWSAIAPAGERIACDGFDEARWPALLKQSSNDEFRCAIDRLSPDARRYRAEFARRDKNLKKKGATA